MNHNLSDYRNKRVKVICFDGDVYVGSVDLFTPAKDNDSEEDAIALSCGVWLDESDIKSITLLTE